MFNSVSRGRRLGFGEGGGGYTGAPVLKTFVSNLSDIQMFVTLFFITFYRPDIFCN